jgi:hypothetical protein
MLTAVIPHRIWAKPIIRDAESSFRYASHRKTLMLKCFMAFYPYVYRTLCGKHWIPRDFSLNYRFFAQALSHEISLPLFAKVNKNYRL